MTVPVIIDNSVVLDAVKTAIAKTGLLPLGLALAACASEPINSSRESTFLQDRLIPRMIEWGRSRSDVLSLRPMLASQGFEKICTVAEYSPLAKIEAEVPGIQSYRGSVGNTVPENRIAVIAIKGGSAHVAYVRTRTLILRNKPPLCSSIEKAVVRRLKPTQPSGPGSIPDVRLEEAG